MKVLHVLHYAQGGIVTVVLEQIRHARAGVEYHIAFLEWTKNVERLVAEYGIRAHFLGVSPIIAMYNYRKLLESLSPDVVHLHSYMPRLMSAVAQQCGFWLGGVVSTIHNDYPHFTGKDWRSRFKRATESAALKILDSPVVVGSKAVQERVEEMYRTVPTQVRVIFNGVEAAVKSCDTVVVNEPIAVAVGRFSTQKNYCALLEAWSIVVRRLPTAKLWLVGDGELRPSLESKVESLNISGSVVFWGWLSRQEVAARLAQARLLVLSSLFESLPTVAIEASLAGLPVISTRVAGIEDIVEHESNGLIVKDQHDLVESLLALLPNAERCQLMGQAGRGRAERLFSPSRCATDIEEVYRTVAPKTLVRQYSEL